MKKFIFILFCYTKLFGQTASISGMINPSSGVTALDFCSNTLQVLETPLFKIGDTVLLMQMKGADYLNVNSISYGDITNYNNAGQYEINYVLQKTATTIVLKNNLLHAYNAAAGAVQLIKVPYYHNAAVTGILSSEAWDGNSGGVLVINVSDTLELFADINVSEKGFLGGAIGTGYSCGSNNWANGTEGGMKGESISKYTPTQDRGGAHLANGGGGSFAANCGAGGGANYGEGGLGGKEYITCSAQRQSIGGAALDYVNNRIMMGGGGGGGEQDNGYTVYPGGRSGGIVIIKCNVLKGNNNHIISNGQSIIDIVRDEGGSGGGAGGSIFIFSNNYVNNILVDANGGTGSSNNDVTYASQCRGPGGGGGAGVLGLSNTILPASINFSAIGGLAGKVLNPASSCYNTSFGAANGAAGGIVLNQVFQESNSVFSKNIDSIRIKDSATNCNSFDFKGFAYTRFFPISYWEWDFGDGGFAIAQNSSHTYANGGAYTIRLIVKDANDCTDTIYKNINVGTAIANAGRDTTVCKNAPFTLQGNGTGRFAWSPSAFLNDSTLQHPIARISTPTKFYLKVTDALGCIGTDTVSLDIKAIPPFALSPTYNGCENIPLQLSASGADKYTWSPAIYLNNPDIANPIATLNNSQLFTVTVKETTCNDSAVLNTFVTIRPLPIITAIKSNDITCSIGSASLIATGASQYNWTPSNGLNTTTGASIVASPLSTTNYTVAGTDNFGCTGKDSVTVNVNFTGKPNYYMPNSFTPNGDGINDCYGIKYFGLVQAYQLMIFNRWGERVYYSTNPTDCWNGYHKGQAVEAGIYIYHLKAQTACGAVDKKDNLLLIR
ncbi:MAG: gliding motility-associated C-terminal domain-containing protein [Chitinophagaceae bacterium]